MILAFVLHFSNLLLAGLLAGSELAVHHGVGAPPLALGDAANIRVRQAAGRRLQILMPGLFLPTAITGVSVTFMSGATPFAWLRWAALLCLVVWIATRALVTVPVNSAILDWSAASPPPGWKDRIAFAQRFHIVGVWASFVAFACFLAANLLALHIGYAKGLISERLQRQLGSNGGCLP